MACLADLPVRHKVYTYILRKHASIRQLLVFRHVDFPEAGVQVPGGTVGPDEEIHFAAQREAEEETGLQDLVVERVLGTVWRDMRGFGFNEVHHRHYYLLTCRDCEKDVWIAYEKTPSDGSVGPIAFRFYWIDLDPAPSLMGGLEEMLCQLR